MSPFTMSVETTEGNSYQHGFHLGTDERLARQLVRDCFAARVTGGYPVITIALKRDHKIVDVFYGDKWHNDL